MSVPSGLKPRTLSPFGDVYAIGGSSFYFFKVAWSILCEGRGWGTECSMLKW